MNPRAITIVGGRVATRDGVRDSPLRLAEGRIAGLEGPRDGDELFDAKGQLVAPGIVDLGVFAIDKPAFRFGGITRAALMPDQNPVLDYPARVNFIAKSGKPDLWVHPLAAATVGLAGDQLAEIALMREAGARGVATGRRWIPDSGVMLRLLQYAGMLDLVVVSHAEDGGLVGSAAATAGEMATRLGLPSAPAEAEALAAARDIALAEMAGARLHLRQVTTRAALELVRVAKRRGVAVTAGVTPAHFMMSDLATLDFRTFARLSPPLRSEDDRQAVREAIADGTIDVVASGHDPRGPEDKRLPFADAAPGMAGAETLLPLTLTLVRDGVIDLARAFDLLAGAPARILGIDAGLLVKDWQADIVVVDPDRPWVIDSLRMAATAGNTPFDRQPTQGRVTALFKGGTPLWRVETSAFGEQQAQFARFLGMESWLPTEALNALVAMPVGEGWVALAFFAVTASVYASGVPGTLLPLSFSSGMVLGWLGGIIVVGAGVMIGSLILYKLLERGSQATLRRRFGDKLKRIDDIAARGGVYPIIGLRLAGLPHLAVTGLCALASIGIRRYAIATFVGVLPAIALSATAGAAL